MPGLTVTFAVVLAIGGIGVLIYFIHHIASTIQASNIVAAATKETLRAVENLFPEPLGQEPEASLRDGDEPAGPWQIVPVSRDGYIQRVDNDDLLKIANKLRTVVRMEWGIGDFVVRDTPLVSLVLGQAPNAKTICAVQRAFSIHRRRTVQEDAAFGIRQIVDIALRALSPSLNDTTTAVLCVDYLTVILSRVATRRMPSAHRYLDGELRVIAIGPTFRGLVELSFNQMLEEGRGNYALLRHVMHALTVIARITQNAGRREVLRATGRRVLTTAADSLQASEEQSEMKEHMQRLEAALNPPFQRSGPV